MRHNSATRAKMLASFLRQVIKRGNEGLLIRGPVAHAHQPVWAARAEMASDLQRQGFIRLRYEAPPADYPGAIETGPFVYAVGC